MFEIDICNSCNTDVVSEPFLRDVVRKTLEQEQVADGAFSIALVDNATIHQLNRRHLSHDYETDVLSFLLEEDQSKKPPESAAPRGAGKRLEGEVVVSVEMAQQTAGRFGWNPRQETILYLVHGLLHLCGYDDQNDDELQLMRSRERAILGLWNYVPHYADGAAQTTSGEER
ncbi:MAG: rRNA maturation RNase YbeY [Planctomycetaceae bacterium]|nr:rRNA maturation RNase YbeY [Planctomycetaceae bacterium]